MKGPLDRTKVVLRHLPPTITEVNLVEHVDSRFSGRYRWFAFRPGKSSTKRLTYSRAYIDFNRPEDVIEFAEFFNGHVFVNEKGTQFKAIVEYAPWQHVPKQCSKKDGREGTLLKDPEYLEFLEFLAKPVENLPSAEIQLERKEAERAGAPKEALVVTPLMDYVRQKRTAKSGSRRTTLNGKLARRVGAMSSGNPATGSSKRGSERRRNSTTMYVLRDSLKNANNKDKPTYLLTRQDNQNLVEKSTNSASVSGGNEALEGESGDSRSNEIGKKKILLLKGKEKEIPHVSGSSLMQQNPATPAKTSHNFAPSKPNQRREASGRIIRSILLNRDRDTHQNQPSLGSHSELQMHNSNQERDRRPPRPPIVQSFQKDANEPREDKVFSNDTEKQERRTRNKDRPDRGVWTPLRRSDGSHASDESLSSSATLTSQVGDSVEGTRAEMKRDVRITRSRGNHYSGDNGTYRHGGRRGSAYNAKDKDGSSTLEGKPSKRGSAGYSSHEKQVWVQKSSSGT